MANLLGRVALVTGAGNGIGAATCLELLKHGVTVIGCDNDVPALENITQVAESEKKNSSCEYGTLTTVVCDLRQETQILEMFEKIRKDHGGVDICIACAGVGYRASLLGGTTEDWRAMLDVNVLAYCICVRESVKQMEAKGSGSQGHVVLINSGAGHEVRVNKPLFDFYNATKYAVTAIAEGIRCELRQRKSDIRLSMVSPGVVETKFTHRMFKGDEEEIDEFYKSSKVLEAKDLADAILFCLKSPPNMEVHDVRMTSTEEGRPTN